jgi:N-acetylglucosamine-6-sulfatase
VHVSRRAALATVALLVLLSACTGSRSPSPSPSGSGVSTPSKVNASGRPNILILLADDQPFRLYSRRLMPEVFSKVVDQGVNFSRGYVNVSQCCPSRSSILTGLYSHDTGVDSNSVRLDGQRPVRPVFVRTLHDHGYRTGLFGKYLNSEPCTPRPGWDRWVCGTRNTQIDPKLNVDGAVVARTGYTADVLADYTIDFIRRNDDPHHPFFAYYAPKVPHLPANDRRSRITLPPYRPPSLNADPDPGSKPAWTRLPPLTSTQAKQAANQYRDMARSVVSLDAAMGRILDALGSRARDTLVIYMSDNGFMYGEHRMTDKNAPYEESVRVPFAIRYPKLLPASDHFESDALVGNVDIAPTIMDLERIPWEADGTSLVPILARRAATVRDAFLIEWCKAGNKPNCRPELSIKSSKIPSYYGVETERFVYVRYQDGEDEMYDLANDPFELTNLTADPAFAAQKQELEARLAELTTPADPPGTTIAVGPVGTVRPGPQELQFFSQDRTTTFRCRVARPGGTGPWTACDSGILNVPAAKAGRYTVTVQAVDRQGHMDPTPAVRSFSVSAPTSAS